MSFVKLYSSILQSTVWLEDPETRLVWITLLAMADATGYVGASVPGLAHTARVSLEACEEALAKFQAPDPHSRTKEHEGRRIEAVDGGWRLLTYAKHRARRDPEARREYERDRKQAYRLSQMSRDVPTGPEMSAQAEAEEEAEAELTPQTDIQVAGAAPVAVVRELHAWYESQLHDRKLRRKPKGLDSKLRRTIRATLAHIREVEHCTILESIESQRSHLQWRLEQIDLGDDGTRQYAGKETAWRTGWWDHWRDNARDGDGLVKVNGKTVRPWADIEKQNRELWEGEGMTPAEIDLKLEDLRQWWEAQQSGTT